MPIKSLFGKTYEVIERSLDITKLRHGLIGQATGRKRLTSTKPSRMPLREDQLKWFEPIPFIFGLKEHLTGSR
jgi:hypothetical protein